MTKPLNTIEKKLKFHCSNCSTTWQLLVIRTDLLTKSETKCLNNCSQKWETLLISYCRERQIIHFANQEQTKDEQKEKELNDLLNQFKKNDQK